MPTFFPPPFVLLSFFVLLQTPPFSCHIICAYSIAALSPPGAWIPLFPRRTHPITRPPGGQSVAQLRNSLR
uniref:Putative secreted protein n=1 Tax=Anopheles triannulatus TaxID=58253 RepID=A0A2M4B5Z4_9DIPT